MFALGLPGFCAYLYFVRVLQSMQRTKVAFYLYLVENGLNIVLALALVHPLGVRGLALSLSIAYTVAALLALAVFHQWFGRLAAPETWAPLVARRHRLHPDGRRRPRRLQPVGVDQRGRHSSPGWWAPSSPAAPTFAAVVIWLGRRHDAARRRPPPPPPPAAATDEARRLVAPAPRIVPYRP